MKRIAAIFIAVLSLSAVAAPAALAKGGKTSSDTSVSGVSASIGLPIVGSN